jgi:hypothetical protein
LRLGDCLRPLTDPVEIQTVAARLHGEVKCHARLLC